MHLNLRHILLRGNTFRGRGYHRGNTFRWNGCHSWGSCGILNCRFYPLSCTCRLLFCTWTCKCTWTPLAHCSCCGASPPPSRQLPAQGHRRWWAASGHRRRTSFLQSIPPPPNHPRTKELKRILVSSRVTNKVEIDDVSQTLSTFLTGMNFPNYLASLEKSSE